MRGAAIACAVVWISLHLLLAPEHVEEEPYIGLSFVLGAGAFIVAIAYLSERWAWNLGAAICLITCIMLVASRTVGLPGDYKESWNSQAILSLTVSVGFLLVYLVQLQAPKEVQP